MAKNGVPGAEKWILAKNVKMKLYFLILGAISIMCFTLKMLFFFSFAHFRLQIDAHWFLGNLKIHVVFTIFLASRYNH